ncbi:MAG: hypothetical protein D3909_04170 [Candidatus Electrothrix sp. ATG1]|nr:hypothetical protein [Candidatus Electrothrix sp. ATG1]MCI5208928.1 hypothetical protein [Candidatus Electrothrix sp. ATG2]
MKKVKTNCWEFKHCGKESNGKKVSEGICPAAIEQRADGIHKGVNAGRCCWVVRDNLCKTQKNAKCLQCDFYHMVRKEEIPSFKVTGMILLEIKKKGIVPVHS